VANVIGNLRNQKDGLVLGDVSEAKMLREEQEYPEIQQRYVLGDSKQEFISR
jgi:hypothetical protein